VTVRCWNFNKNTVKKILEKRKEADKGKRARGRMRTMWITPMVGRNFQEFLKFNY